MAPLLITNVRIILPDSIMSGWAAAEDGVITAVSSGPAPAAIPPGTELVDGGGCYLAPGFIDIHNHGRLGRDAMEGPEALETIARGQAEHGVTAFLAGTSTVPWEKSLDSIRAIAAWGRAGIAERASAGVPVISGTPKARCLGIYSEGNFFSREKRGAHNPAWLKGAITREDLDALLDGAGSACPGADRTGAGFLRVMALSPELPGAEEAIARLRRRGVIVSAAHTNCGYETAMAAINSGITLSTHTFNGMRSLDHQEPGILGAVLNDDRVSCELIADGIHLAPAILSLVYRIKGPDRVILVSDSVSLNGVPEGRYRADGQEVTVSNGAIRLKGGAQDGKLAGSCLSLDRAVRNMVTLGGASLPEAVRMASHNPARLLGLEKWKGSVETGKDADLVLLDEELTVKRVFIA